MSAEIILHTAITVAMLVAGFVAKRVAILLQGRFQSTQWLRQTLCQAVESSAMIVALGLAIGHTSLSPLIETYFGPVPGEGAPPAAQWSVPGVMFLTARIIVRIGLGMFLIQCAGLLGHWLSARAAKSKNKIDDMLTPILVRVLRVLIISVVILEIAHVLTGSEIKTILAGLGIGGLAVALAAQDTLRNILGAIIIFMEKPFNLGDRIIIGEHDGTIESVGLRSTKLRRLDGHLVTIPNGNLSGTMIHNVAKRPYIRRLFNISITYDTPPDKIREAKGILEDVLKDHEGMSEEFPPRVYFNEFKAYSLDFLCIYWYHPPAYWDFLAFGEKINTEIVDRFNAAGIEFAFPTQTLYLRPDERGTEPPGMVNL